MVREEAIRHPSATPDNLIKAINHPDMSTQMEALKHKNVNLNYPGTRLPCQQLTQSVGQGLGPQEGRLWLKFNASKRFKPL